MYVPSLSLLPFFSCSSSNILPQWRHQKQKWHYIETELHLQLAWKQTWRILLSLCQFVETTFNLWYINLLFCITIFVTPPSLSGDDALLCVLTLHHYLLWWTRSPTHCSSLNQRRGFPGSSPSVFSPLPFILFALKGSSRTQVINHMQDYWDLPCLWKPLIDHDALPWECSEWQRDSSTLTFVQTLLADVWHSERLKVSACL